MMYGLLKDLVVTVSPKYTLSGVQHSAVIWLARRYTISRRCAYPLLTEIRVSRLGSEPFNFSVEGWSTYRKANGTSLGPPEHFAAAACRELHTMGYMDTPSVDIEQARKRLIVCARVMTMLNDQNADPNLVRRITSMVP